MQRRDLLLAAFSLALATPAAAAEPPKPQDDLGVTLSPVALPIIVDGRLINYVFATVKVVLRPGVDSVAMREKEPYFRDALVRAAHRTPFVLPHDYNHVDTAKLRAAMLREAAAIAGPGAIRDVVVVEQTTQHPMPSPRPAAPPSH